MYLAVKGHQKRKRIGIYNAVILIVNDLVLTTQRFFIINSPTTNRLAIGAQTREPSAFSLLRLNFNNYALSRPCSNIKGCLSTLLWIQWHQNLNCLRGRDAFQGTD